MQNNDRKLENPKNKKTWVYIKQMIVVGTKPKKGDLPTLCQESNDYRT